MGEAADPNGEEAEREEGQEDRQAGREEGSATRSRLVYTEALDEARAGEAAFVDETSWQMKHRTHWLWVKVTGVASVFMIHARRNALAAKALLGGFAGNLVTDRCTASWCGAIPPAPHLGCVSTPAMG